MSSCGHQIKPTAMEILTLQIAFRCPNCKEYVEPTRPWRIARAWLNAICLIGALYAAFSHLQGTLKALALMLGIIALALLAFFGLNYLLLTMAPLQAARADINPDLQDDYYDDESEDGDEDIVEEDRALSLDAQQALERRQKKP